MDLQPLLQFINHQRMQPPEKTDQDMEEEKPLGKPVIMPVLYNHEQYLKRAMEYASNCLLKNMGGSRELNKRHFKRAMLQLGVAPLAS